MLQSYNQQYQNFREKQEEFISQAREIMKKDDIHPYGASGSLTSNVLGGLLQNGKPTSELEESSNTNLTSEIGRNSRM